MLTEKEKYKQLVEDTEEALQVKDIRLLVITFGLYSVYIVDELMKLELNYNLDKDIKSQELKLKILRATEKLADSEYNVLYKLNKIRNRYSHDLEIDEEEIRRLIFEMPINFDVEENRLREMENEIRENPTSWFQLACLAKMEYLFKQIASLKGEEWN